MKFFTLDWWRGIQEGTRDDPWPWYARHLETIRKSVPPDLMALQESISLHDSRLRELYLDTEQKILRLRLDGDDGHGGLRVFELRYFGVSMFRTIADPENGFAGPYGYGDLGYDEADMAPTGEVEHRILFSSGIEFSIRFADFKLTCEDATSQGSVEGD